MKPNQTTFNTFIQTFDSIYIKKTQLLVIATNIKDFHNLKKVSFKKCVGVLRFKELMTGIPFVTVKQLQIKILTNN